VSRKNCATALFAIALTASEATFSNAVRAADVRTKDQGRDRNHCTAGAKLWRLFLPSPLATPRPAQRR